MTDRPRESQAGAPGTVPSALAVWTDHLVKEFGFRRVLDGVSIAVQRGSFFTLFGPNGAGKTTLIRILTTVSRPTSGAVRIAGKDLRGGSRIEVRSKIGFLSHQTLLYDALTGLENLVFFAGLYGVNPARARAEHLLGELRLWERRNDLVGTYSRGMLQRLSIARALLHDPEILLLDEPFTGLDPDASRLLTQLLMKLREGGRSAVLVTHDLAGGLALSDRWAVLSGGRIASEGPSARTTLSELTSLYFELARADSASGSRPSGRRTVADGAFGADALSDSEGAR